jgi:hypothetical protein
MSKLRCHISISLQLFLVIEVRDGMAVRVLAINDRATAFHAVGLQAPSGDSRLAQLL